MIMDEKRAWKIRQLRNGEDFKDFLNYLIEWRAELREESDTTVKDADFRVSQGKRQVLTEILGLGDEADRLINTLEDWHKMEDSMVKNPSSSMEGLG